MKKNTILQAQYPTTWAGITVIAACLLFQTPSHASNDETQTQPYTYQPDGCAFSITFPSMPEFQTITSPNKKYEREQAVYFDTEVGAIAQAGCANYESPIEDTAKHAKRNFWLGDEYPPKPHKLACSNLPQTVDIYVASKNRVIEDGLTERTLYRFYTNESMLEIAVGEFIKWGSSEKIKEALCTIELRQQAS
ncbi:hypothetical protein [Pseudohaliea rubra]|uniref:hypothetical protein n=1 Tax=Pseudohaliea rubra TaxID=475795 RepID=UPI0011858BBD|nr:hypothetical protein [Pseudohaliea rubra]